DIVYPSSLIFSLFFHYTPTPDIYTLSLHDALPICLGDHAVNRRRHTLSRETADAAGAVRSGVSRQRRSRQCKKPLRRPSSHLPVAGPRRARRRYTLAGVISAEIRKDCWLDAPPWPRRYSRSHRQAQQAARQRRRW